MALFFATALLAVAAAWWLSRGVAVDGEILAARGVDAGEVKVGGLDAGAVGSGGTGDVATAAQGAPISEGGSVNPGGGEPASSAATHEPLTPPGPAPPSGALVALVIDDLGRRVEDVARLAALGVPLSYAVLPFESHTSEVLAAVERIGGEILLHLPMEGRDGANPGPGALRVGMPEAELVAATRAAMEAVPGAVGVNNHMGSVLSADASSMRAVLAEIAGDGVYFLDSRTTAESVAYPAARQLGMAAAERDVFLDGELDAGAVRRQFYRVLEVARETGAGIAIGHPHEVTMGVLEEEVPRAVELGYRFVVVSALVDRSVLPE